MVKGGIGFQIRREIKKSIIEEEIDGTKEYVLNNILIYKTYKLSQFQNEREKNIYSTNFSKIKNMIY